MLAKSVRYTYYVVSSHLGSWTRTSQGSGCQSPVLPVSSPPALCLRIAILVTHTHVPILHLGEGR